MLPRRARVCRFATALVELERVCRSGWGFTNDDVTLRPGLHGWYWLVAGQRSVFRRGAVYARGTYALLNKSNGIGYSLLAHKKEHVSELRYFKIKEGSLPIESNARYFCVVFFSN